MRRQFCLVTPEILGLFRSRFGFSPVLCGQQMIAMIEHEDIDSIMACELEDSNSPRKWKDCLHGAAPTSYITGVITFIKRPYK